MTAPATALTVKASAVKPGDRIGRRVVRTVVKGSSGSTRNASNSHGQNHGARLPNLTFTSNVISIHFEDREPPVLHRFPGQDVEIERP